MSASLKQLLRSIEALSLGTPGEIQNCLNLSSQTSRNLIGGYGGINIGCFNPGCWGGDENGGCYNYGCEGNSNTSCTNSHC